MFQRLIGNGNQEGHSAMSKREIEISAEEGTEAYAKLHEIGVLEVWNGRKFNAGLYTEANFKDGLDTLSDEHPLRLAFQKASAEMDRHKVADIFRLWAGWSTSEAYDGGGYLPLREVSVEIEGYPNAKLTISKYRSCAFTPRLGYQR